jgi:hypothetical protein
MSSQSNKMFNAMEARDWNKVTEIIATTSFTRNDLKEMHGVQRYYILFALTLSYVALNTVNRRNIIRNIYIISFLCHNINLYFLFEYICPIKDGEGYAFDQSSKPGEERSSSPTPKRWGSNRDE